ncbi:hypothetical protein [Bacillus sp. FJAT-42315]|uniref:hypothetical protein n=1 Tax=Bacillus sp. FJAT-42315 TaxID=2014077 RepID=UPI000C24566C|nr:hypothetical protein [Bacillus sp. FJAT-42315]
MRGSILWNIWIMIAGFTLYFLLSFPNGEPLPVILGSFATATIFFMLMFVIRFMLFIAFPPDSFAAEPVVEEELSTKEETQEEIHEEEMPIKVEKDGQAKRLEMTDSEKTAAIIREMINE